MVKKAPEILDDRTGNSVLSLRFLLLDRNVPVPTLAAAIDRFGIYALSGLGQFGKANKEEEERARVLLRRQYTWEYGYHDLVGDIESPVEELNTTMVPGGYRDYGWPFHKCPDFDSLTAMVGVLPTAGEAPPQAKPETSNWKMLVQTEAARRWAALREGGANPTKHSIKIDLQRWCVEKGLKTRTGINPTAEYIYRHVLRDWKPPND